MPTIIKTFIRVVEKTKRTHQDKREVLDNVAVYNTRIWRKLRKEKLRINPLCENCQKLDKLSLAEEVHHVVPISSGKDILEKKLIGFNYNNLQSLYIECHKKITKMNNQ